jgi:hypothetical protein
MNIHVYYINVVQDTMAMMMNHLRRVAAHCDKNKMTINNLAICFGPVLLCPAPSSSSDPAVDFSKHIDVLRYLLEIWECDNGTGEFMEQAFICFAGVLNVTVVVCE